MTNKLFIILLFTIMISIIGCVSSCNTTNKLSGTLYVAGNEPFTYLALDTKDRIVYKIECSDSLKNDLWQLQGENVSVDYNEIKKYDRLNIVVINGYSVKDLENKDLNKGK